jgi:serine protease AprX
MKDEGTVIRSDDQIASYSSKGPTSIDHIVKPDLVAPGNHINSLQSVGATLENMAPTNIPLISYYVRNGPNFPSTDYFTLNGTSMAAPMVSGAAALLLQKNPALTPDQVKAKLMLSATKNFPAYSVATDSTTGQSYTSQYDIFTVGAGYLDVWAALNTADPPAGSAISPTALYN